MRTAPIAKFGATTAPSFRFAHSSSSSRMNASDSPVVPITSRTPASSAASREPRRPLGVREIDRDVRLRLLDDRRDVRAERNGARSRLEAE